MPRHERTPAPCSHTGLSPCIPASLLTSRMNHRILSMYTMTRIHSKPRAPELVSMDGLSRAAECLKVLAHPVRLRIVDVILQGEFPVHRIAELCGVQPHQACEHLRLMKGYGLLASRRVGRTVYYRVAAPQLPGIFECIRRSCETDKD
jgi:ArsR family transcriptional regulator, zinc-responsive transcriptional repressor